MKSSTRRPRDVQLSEHFAEREFACTCKGTYCDGIPRDGIHPLLPVLLEEIRELAGGVPVAISSGYRCPGRNRAVGGARKSFHKRAMAADIRAKGGPVRKLHQLAEQAMQHLRQTDHRFKDIRFGLGYYPRRFVHVDVRKHKALWTG